jgi:outer membrane protein OmpA-like peptidoglycan-associated protein
LLKRYPNIQIEIQGHVCCTPSFHKDAVDIETRKRELSKNRAERVYKFLHSRGIGKVRMTFKGYGNTQPIGKDEQFDRRVELVITKI